VADEKFCETTIGCKDPQLGNEFKLLFQTVNFRFGLPTGYSIVYAGAISLLRNSPRPLFDLELC
jgi:glycerol-3-phosphate dehydrogenase